MRNDGIIQFLDEEPIATGETRTYLVAVPYTTNLKKAVDQSNYLPVSFYSRPTIYFGGKGLEGFQWTLERFNNTGTFRAVKTSMTMDKKAWDEDNSGWKSLGNAPMGYPSQYRLSGFSTSGNVYISGTDDGLSYGPYISEDLPENYEINAVDFRIERNANGTNPANTMLTPGSTVSGIAGLNNWFDAEHNYLEFEICSQNRYDSWITSNSKYWVRMPDSVTPQYQGTVTEDGKTYDVWRLGGAGTVNDLTSVLERNGFSAKVRNTAITSGKPWFTGNMRILFANKLQQNISVPVQVVVQGTMRKPKSDGPAGHYQNKATLISGAPTWVPPINVEEKYRGHWGATPSQVVKTADLNPKGPVEPGVHAFGYSFLNNGLTWGKEGGLKAVALDQDGGGVLFALTNDCTSMMEPGVLTTSRLSENDPLANGGNAQNACGCQYHHEGDYDPATDSFFSSDGWQRAGHEGFIPSHVVLSPELLKHMDVAKLTLHSVHEDAEHGGTGPVVLTRSLLQQYVVGANGATQAEPNAHYSADLVGGIVIPQRVWGSTHADWPEAPFDYLEIEFDSFDGSVGYDKEHPELSSFLLIHGVNGRLGEPENPSTYCPVGLEIKTNYDDPEDNVPAATGHATLFGSLADPKIHAFGFEFINADKWTHMAEGTTGLPTADNTQNVNAGERQSGFAFYLENDTPAPIYGGTISTNAMAYQIVDDGFGASKLVGFDTSHIEFSQALLNAATLPDQGPVLTLEAVSLDTAGQPVVHTYSYTQQQFLNWRVTNANAYPYPSNQGGHNNQGAVVVPKSAWGNFYLTKVELKYTYFTYDVPFSSYDEYAAQHYPLYRYSFYDDTVVNRRPSFSLFGTATSPGLKELTGTFRADENAEFQPVSAEASSIARIKTREPGNDIEAVGYEKNAPGDTQALDYSSAVWPKQRKDVYYAEGRSGYSFYVGNSSSSKILDGVITIEQNSPVTNPLFVSRVTDGGVTERRGFQTEYLVLNKALLANSLVKRVKIETIDDDGTPSTLTIERSQLEQLYKVSAAGTTGSGYNPGAAAGQEGAYVIPQTVWGSQHLTRIQVEVSQFNANIDPSPFYRVYNANGYYVRTETTAAHRKSKPCVILQGSPTRPGELDMKCTFDTDYQKYGQTNVSTNENAVLVVRPAEPRVVAYAYGSNPSRIYSSNPRNSLGEPTNVNTHKANANNERDDSGYVFHLVTRTPSMLNPGSFKTSDIPLAWDAANNTNRGFTTNRVVLSKALLANATGLAVTFTAHDGSAVTLDAAQLQSYKVASNGTIPAAPTVNVGTALAGAVVVPASVWGPSALKNVEVRFSSFKGSVDFAGTKNAGWEPPANAAAGTFVELQGVANDPKNELWVTGTFRSTYYRDAMRDESASDKAALVTTTPIPSVIARAFDNTAGGGAASNLPCDSLQGSRDQTAPLFAQGSGYIFQLGTGNRSAMKPSVFSTGTLPSDPYQGALRGFETKHLYLSKALNTAATVAKVTVKAKDAAGVVSTFELTKGNGTPSLNLDAYASAGAYDITPEAWDNQYLVSVSVEFSYFDGGVALNNNSTITHGAMAGQPIVALVGRGTLPGRIPLQGTFSTVFRGYVDDVSRDDTSALIVETVKPELTVTSGWSLKDPVTGATTVHTPQAVPGTDSWGTLTGSTFYMDSIPYRWGEDQDYERAWIDFTVKNDTAYSAQGLDLDAILEQTAIDGAGKRTGFVPTELVVSGFANTTDGWRLKGTSIVEGLDIFAAPTRPLGGTAHFDNDLYATRLTMADLAGYIDGTGALHLRLDDATATGVSGVVKALRLRFATFGSAMAGANVITMRVYGMMEHHGIGTMPSEVLNGTSYNGGVHIGDLHGYRSNPTRYINATAHLFPCSGDYGNGIERTTTAPIPIQGFRFGTGSLFEGYYNERGALNYDQNADCAFRDPNSYATDGSARDNIVVVAHKDENSGYILDAYNETEARSDTNAIVYDMESVGNKASMGAVSVHGFKTRTVRFDAGLVNVGKLPAAQYAGTTGTPADTSTLKTIDFYFADPATGAPGATPNVSVAVADLPAYRVGNEYVFDIDNQAAFAGVKGRYLKQVKVNYGTFAPKYVCKRVQAKFTGLVDWYTTADENGYLPGRVTALQTGMPSGMPARNATNAHFLSVVKPYLGIDTHGQYGDVYENWQFQSANSDKDRTHLSVPYDRDYQLWTRIYNKQSVSKLELCDVIMDLAVKRETYPVEDSGSVTGWTGFHTFQVTVRKELMDQFVRANQSADDVSAVGEARLYGMADSATSLPNYSAAPQMRLVPVLAADGRPQYFEDVQHGNARYDLNAAGHLVITEQQLRDNGIENLTRCVLYHWKGMKRESSNVDMQRVVFDGFSDNDFGTDSLALKADSHMYMGGIDYDAQWDLKQHDDTAVLVSKMLFDTVTRAAYTDNRTAKRFDRWASSNESGHEAARRDNSTYTNSFADDKDHELQIGYKAQGSFLVDFRQGRLAETEKVDHYEYSDAAVNPICPTSHYYVGNWGNKTFNTAATLVLEQTLPADDFDAYFVKIHPQALKFVESIQVVYGDGSAYTVSKQDLAAHANNGNSAPTGSAARYTRLDLLYKDGAGKHQPYFQAAASNDKTYAYREAFGTNTAKNDRVAKVVYSLRINQTGLVGGVAQNPDFGSWFQWDEIEADPFEVTGRFVPVDGRNLGFGFSDVYAGLGSSTVKAEVRVGGSHNLSNTHARKAAVRYDRERDHSASDDYKSKFSWQDYHRKKDYVPAEDMKMRHLRASVGYRVYESGNYVRVAAMSNINGATTLTEASFDSREEWPDYPKWQEGLGVRGNWEKAPFGKDTQYKVSFNRWQVPYHTPVNYLFNSNDTSYGGGFGQDLIQAPLYNKEYPLQINLSDYWTGLWRNKDFLDGGHMFDFYKSNWRQVSFADEITIHEDLPTCVPEANATYYGFLTTGLTLPYRNGKYTESKPADEFDDDDGDGGGDDGGDSGEEKDDPNDADDAMADSVGEADEEFRSILRYVDHIDLHIASYTVDALGDPTGLVQRRTETIDRSKVDFLKAWTEQKNVHIRFDHGTSVDPAGQLTAGTNSPFFQSQDFLYVVNNLGPYDFVESYDVVLKNIPGSADYNDETGFATYSNGDKIPKYNSWSRSDLDMLVYGRPYTWKATEKSIWAQMKKDSINTVWTSTRRSYSGSKVYTEKTLDRGTASGYGDNDHYKDRAYIAAFPVPIDAKTILSPKEGVNTAAGRYEDGADLYDYAADNVTPNIGTMEARFQNAKDKGSEDATGRATHISHVKLTADIAGDNDGRANGWGMRLQNVYVPRGFIENLELNRAGDINAGYEYGWFEVAEFSFTVDTDSGPYTFTGTWQDVVDLGIVSNPGTSAKYPHCYVVDIEAFLRAAVNGTAANGA